jgi:predicted dehydrogenase
VVLDIGPYYVSQLVMMLGPVSEVTARGIVGQVGRDYPVGVPTTVAATLGFESGVQATMTLSLDVWQHSHPPLEIYGTLGTLTLPDPNFFGGEPRLCVGKGPWESVPLGGRPWSEDNFELPFGTFANYRGAGLDDMVRAIIEDGPHQASGRVAAHVLDVLERILVSVRTARSAP